MEKTIGEKRVRTDFNVSGDDTVTQIKKATADLINQCESLKPKSDYVLDLSDSANTDNEKRRLIALAQTAYEEAAMWAVKAATI